MIIYRHTQDTPASTWTIDHNQDFTACSVEVYVDVAGTPKVILPATVTKVTSNQIVISFSDPQQGFAELKGTTGEVVDYTNFVQPVERTIDYTHTPIA